MTTICVIANLPWVPQADELRVVLSPEGPANG